MITLSAFKAERQNSAYRNLCNYLVRRPEKSGFRIEFIDMIVMKTQIYESAEAFH